ncbi:hypothetical protein LCGC14_0503020 [marine sediment metagenome]|uniref:Uncharacterized protein n=1 Tax=marine sediment metagenome TaxID=412755 RepID=A0A0F9S8K0_9ZZZZ
MKNIIIGLVGLIILISGIFIYVKIQDNNSIDALNIAVENYRTGTEQLLDEIAELGKQLIIYESIIIKAENRNTELGNILNESAKEIERSINSTERIKDITSEFENAVKDSLSIIEELREYDFTE